MAAPLPAELRRRDRSPRPLRPQTVAPGPQRVPPLPIAPPLGAAAIPERPRCTTDDESPRAASQGIARRVEPQASVIKFPLMQMASTAARFRLRPFLSVTKPRVASLTVFCPLIGMFLAVGGMVPP